MHAWYLFHLSPKWMTINFKDAEIRQEKIYKSVYVRSCKQFITFSTWRIFWEHFDRTSKIVRLKCEYKNESKFGKDLGYAALLKPYSSPAHKKSCHDFCSPLLCMQNIFLTPGYLYWHDIFCFVYIRLLWIASCGILFFSAVHALFSTSILLFLRSAHEFLCFLRVGGADIRFGHH